MVYHHLKKVHPHTWYKLAGGLLLLVILFSIFPYGTLLQWLTFDRIIDWVKHAQSNTWTLIIFFCAFTLGVLGLPITIFPIVGGVLFNFWIAFPLNVLAATSGAWLAYGIAHFFGRDAVEGILKGRLKSFDEATSQKGIKTVVIIRWLGVPPFGVANYAFGLSGIKTRDYLIGTAIGIAPWMALMTFLSSSLWKAALMGGQKGLMSAVATKMAPLVALSLTISVTAIVIYAVKKKRQGRTEQPKE